MKQGLQLRLSQQLAMTPQLQQAIRLLHLSTAELQQEIQLALVNNPLLEQTNSHVEIDTKETVNPEDFDSLNPLEKENIPEEFPLDVTWEEMYNTSMSFGMVMITAMIMMIYLSTRREILKAYKII